ncbi:MULTISPECIES: TVP38/TMEM64 family protein [Pontibacillus]|uniref:TVP38/TMEM64 family membrane protein n=1 Tax=Pontibacillus chungwhensis TaxID=265426 RepID=A0ABY8V3A2_9BACI|nr:MULTISPECIES: TVP38/TMEM64 family protein [Pontibacillus]MCD5325803.1 TVP38/TMEM64 family protein [Pontibacillus sp. HN14]WIF98336.1 TVP38/TMEM64 family protein [Pontibacillus chungwhensis]
MKQLKNWIKPVIVLILFGIAAYIVRFEFNLGKDEISTFVQSFGWWSPFIFFLIYALGPIVFFPTSILSLVAGFVYGVWPGFLYILFGATGAAVTGYIMGRFFGDSLVKVQNFSWSEQLFKKIDQNGFLYVLILRLTPIVGFDLLSYVSGITRVNFRSFIPATMIGMFPGTLVYSYLGASLGTGNVKQIMLAVSLLLALMAITFLFRERIKRWLGFTG